MENYDGMSISEIAVEIQRKAKSEEEKILLLMSNIDYIHWIDNYIEVNKGFSEDDLICFSSYLSIGDKEHIGLLPLFYRGISNYAGNHYTYAKFNEFGEYYNLKYENIGLEVGILEGENLSHYCNKIEIKEDDSFIDFQDILLENTQERVDQITESLNGIAESIIEAYENGIPLRSIENTVISSIKNVKEKHKEKRYK